ncbi:MAG: hypothetical protein ACLTC1_05880 [Turicibacter sp.]
MGVAIDASEVEIYSDVNGIYTADPRLVPDALKLIVSVMQKCWN